MWLEQKENAKLFGKAISTINEHIKNILEDELIENEVMRKFWKSELSTKPTNFYNLDLVLSVEYRVNSKREIQFRKCTFSILNNLLALY